MFLYLPISTGKFIRMGTYPLFYAYFSNVLIDNTLQTNITRPQFYDTLMDRLDTQACLVVYS